MTDDSWKLANDRELIEYRKGVVEDLAEYQADLTAIDTEIRQRNLAGAEAHTPTDDEREELADRLARKLIGDPKQLMLAEGTGALHVALSESIRSVIEDVYADCGDSDAGVLSSNIARRLAWDLPPAIIALRRPVVPEPSTALVAIERAKTFLTDVSETNEMRNRNAYGALIAVEVAAPQGEPSDAQALLAIRDDIVRNGGRADAAVLAGLERLASRAAGAVTEQGENRNG